MRMSFALAGALAVSLIAFTAHAEVAAPQVSLADIAHLPTPLPLPYNDKSDADADVAAAFAKAKANGKRVLIDFGGNWCADCRIMAGVMELPELKPFVEAHYEVVTVDVGRFDRNLHIPKRYGIEKLEGVPTALIVEADGTLINAANASEVANAREMTPQDIANWLARYAKPAAE